jgi:uncharacterized alpha-E superfamily protein
MLSRVAERVYWMSRYLERVENSARLVAVYGELLLDLPEEAKLDWSFALQILGMEAAYRESGGSASELEFLLISENNVASLMSGIGFARENARTTRDIVPSEAWRAINELHIYAANNLPNMARRPGSRIPAELVGKCHEITGILEGTMSHGPAYQFVRLGRSLERIDMTSRIIDVAAAIMLAGRDELQLHESTIWRAVLRAQGAYQMYRQYVRRRILGHDVVAFLLQDESFPRSVTHCMGVLENALGKLPRSDKAQVQMDAVRARLAEVSVEDLDHAHLHQFADDLQLELAKLNDVIFDTWLNPLSAA